MTQSIMMDLETLSTETNAVILSLGAVKFDDTSLKIDRDRSIYLKFDIDQQTATLNRDISDNTMKWWKKQSLDSPEIVESAFSTDDRKSVEECLDELSKFCWNAGYIWSQGSFDVNIMEHLYQQMDRPAPWRYYQICDSRTLFNFVDGSLDRSNHHDALEDAISQASGVQRALRRIGWRGVKL